MAEYSNAHARDASSDARGLRLAVVVSRYNSDITERLLQGADEAFRRLGGDPQDLHITHVPGAFELPIAAQAAAESPDIDAVVALGCLIRGETVHDRVIADAVAGGLMRVGLDARKPVLFGVLTVETPEQALARAGGSVGNKGAEAVAAAIETIHALRRSGERSANPDALAGL